LRWPIDDVPWTLTSEEFDLDRVLDMATSTSISVIIPAKNEAATIGAVLDAVTHHEGLVNELLVVNDHSNDDTATVARIITVLKVINLAGPSGKGEAMTAGLEAASSSETRGLPRRRRP
jgi:glycosyltransferase involved in cell wall biosynthesis